MYLGIFKTIFIIISILLAISIIIQKIFMKKLKNTSFPAIIAVLLFLYILGTFIAAILLPHYVLKLIMFILGIAPFIIGKLATYKTEGLFTFIQIICALSGGVLMYISQGV